MQILMKTTAALFILLLGSTIVQADDSLKAGEKVFNKACMMCHGSGLAGAPKYGDSDAWAPRIEKGLDALVESAKNGLGVMPPKGGCADCSDDDLKAAVKYMVKAAE